MTCRFGCTQNNHQPENDNKNERKKFFQHLLKATTSRRGGVVLLGASKRKVRSTRFHKNITGIRQEVHTEVLRWSRKKSGSKASVNHRKKRKIDHIF